MSEELNIFDEIDQRHNIIQELSLMLLNKLSTAIQNELQQFPKLPELAAFACGIHSASHNLDEGIEHRYNAVKLLSKVLVDKLWSDSQCEFQMLSNRFELAALAGGIHLAINEVFDLLAKHPEADE